MKNLELNQQLEKIKELISKVDNACYDDFELQSQWAKHICVLVAGFIENSIKEILREYTVSRAEARVIKYVVSRLKGIRNPKSGKIIEIFRSYSVSWADDIKSYLDNDGRGDAVDSIMNNRHHIVHGQTSSITLVRVKDYIEKIVDTIDYLEKKVA